MELDPGDIDTDAQVPLEIRHEPKLGSKVDGPTALMISLVHAGTDFPVARVGRNEILLETAVP